MTMLDRMRRHKNWLKWSLALVVLAFILLYIPDFLRGPTGANANDVVASVDGNEITVSRFRRAYNQQMQSYRAAYGANMNEQLLKQLGIDQRIVQQMIEEEAALAEARKLGIGATDEEVRERILSLPAFQENGAFIGDARYRQMLQIQNPPMRPADFEEQVRRGITVEKLQGALTDWITVSDAEVETEFKRRNEKVKLAVLMLPTDTFREGVEATDAEIAAYFAEHSEQYRVPEKRTIRYALVDMQAIRARTPVSAEDVKRYYDDNVEQYSTPEQVRASHILLETEGKDEEEVKKRAEELAAKAKAGADFAKLANENTDEEIGKTRGGDLDFFSKGQMVPAFDEVAFSMKPGEISDPVKTQYGYHIIKVTDKRAASTRPLTEVHAQIEDQLKWERAQAEAQRIADDVASKLKAPADFDTVAKPRGLTVADSTMFSREEPIAGLGMAPAVTERAFAMQQGEVSEAIRTPQGFAFITVTGTQDAYVPKLEEVKARVREDVIAKKARDTAQQRASEIAAKAKSDFDAAAKAAGVEVKTTEFIARGAPIADAGVSPAVDAAAFALQPGGVSDAVMTDNGAVIVKVLERQDPPASDLASGKDALKTELLNQQRNRFFASYMAKARERMRVTTNPQLIAEIVG